MPTFTTVALETLLEPRFRDSYKNDLSSGQRLIPKSSSGVDGVKEEEETKKEKNMRVGGPNHVYRSPALYITPVPAPIPDSSSDPVSPSPYVVNHKRRGRGGVGRRVVGFDEAPEVKSLDGVGEGDFDVEEAVHDNLLGAEIGGDGVGIIGHVAEDDDFFDPRGDTVSTASSTDVDDFVKPAECRSCVSNQGEFFDADEDFSSGSSITNLSSPYGPRIESELCATRLSLLEEIERRKSAEYAVSQMYSQWQRLGNLLWQTGLTFPTPPTATSAQFESDSLEQFCQEILVAKFVSEAMGRGQARAEAEIAAEAIIESKDQEISRLRDKLQYYEAVNREMCQRNQEVMEAARRQRQRKKIRQKWLWGCIGVSVAIGASVIAYTYFPQTSNHPSLPSSSDSSDVSHITMEESALD